MLLEAQLQVELSPIQWQDWLKDPVTQEIFRVLQVEREEWVRRLAEGDVLKWQPGTEIKETAHAVGVIRGLDDILSGIQEQLRMQWDEAQAALNAEMMKKEEEI
jgi:hypothetical protein